MSFDVLLLLAADFRLVTHTVRTVVSTHTMTGVTVILEFQNFSITVKYVTSFWLFFVEQCTTVTESQQVTSVWCALGYALLVLAAGCCKRWVKFCHKEIQHLFLVFSSKSVPTNIKLNITVSFISQIIWMYKYSLQLKCTTQNKATCATLYKANSTPSSLSDHYLNSHCSSLTHFLCKNIATYSLIFCVDQKASFLTIK